MDAGVRVELAAGREVDKVGPRYWIEVYRAEQEQKAVAEQVLSTQGASLLVMSVAEIEDNLEQWRKGAALHIVC